MKQALLLIDIQNDFCPSGSLAVPNGDQVVPVANWWIRQFSDGLIIATQDWHPANHGSFASNNPGKKPFEMGELNGLPQCMWTDHCVQNTYGAEFHPDLLPIPFVFCKGEDPTVDSYSGFFDNGRLNKTQLDGFLNERGITELIIMGLSTDYCVKFTVLDALELGYKVKVIADGCRGVNIKPDDSKEAFKQMHDVGAEII
jgi:nicotinamidase/pyrazinamidase